MKRDERAATNNGNRADGTRNKLGSTGEWV